MSKEYKTIEIPSHLYEDFLWFLDIALGFYSPDELDTFTENELEVFDFIEDLVGRELHECRNK